MNPKLQHFFEFGPFRLDTHERVLWHDGRPISVTPKAVDCLIVLVENNGHIVEKDELMNRVWPDTFVEEVNLARHVSTLRKLLGDSLDDHRYIETVPKRGYRFIADVRETRDDDTQLIVDDHTTSTISIEEDDDQYAPGGVAAQTPHVNPTDQSWPMAASGIRKTAVKSKTVLQFAIVSVVVMVAAFLLYKYLIRRPAPFHNLRMAKATNTGKSSDAVISRDEKYIAYVLNESGQRSIWVRQVATSSIIQIVSSTGDWYGGLSFSPDGNYVFYGRNDGKNRSGFYRVPVLGGLSTKLMEVVSSPITFSPDGKRFAFVRRYVNQGETALIIANSDGTGEQKIATRKHPDFFGMNPSKPAWSPDGKVIACPAGTYFEAGYRMKVVEVRLDTGKEGPISSHDWRWIRALEWLADGSGLVMTALEYEERMIGSGNHFQIWHLPYPDGEPRRITNDSNEYLGISVTADSNTMVTTQVDALQNLWVAPNSDADNARQITSGASKYFGVSWMPNGRITYASITSGDPDIWTMDADGNNQRQLTTNARANGNPSVSPDGRYIFFYSTRAGTHIWRMDSDGSNPKQLTNGLAEYFPQVSPDGSWMVYQTTATTKPTVWKVDIDGREPRPLTDEHAMFPVISPDGKLVAYIHQDDGPNPKRGLAVITSEGQLVSRFALPPSANFFVRWTRDGNALAYIDTRDGISNIWSQPLDGSPPNQLTNFKSEQMFSFDWSPDGKDLACVRGVVTTDVVLINNLN